MPDPMTCPTCNQPHDPSKCSGHAKSTRRQCSAYPIKGGTVCIKHGGKAAQVRAAADRRLEDDKLAAAVATYGLPLDISPSEALLDEVKWTAGHVAWLRARVQEMETKALSWGVSKREDHGATEFPGINETESAVPPVLLELYTRERKHLLDVCKAAITAGIEERRVKLAESQGALIASVIRRVLTDLDLSPEQSVRAAEAVPRHLRAVAG